MRKGCTYVCLLLTVGVLTYNGQFCTVFGFIHLLTDSLCMFVFHLKVVHNVLNCYITPFTFNSVSTCLLSPEHTLANASSPRDLHCFTVLSLYKPPRTPL